MKRKMDTNEPFNRDTAHREGTLRKWRFGTYATVLTVAVVVGIVLLNMVVSAVEARFPLSLDLTADETYTLSKDTMTLLDSIDEDVQVVAFQEESYYSTPSFGQDDINTIARQFYEAMRQCQTRTNGRVTIQYIDYAGNPTQVKKYADYEVNEHSILFLCGERHWVTTLTDMFTYDENSYYYYGTIAVTESLVDRTVASGLLKVTGNLAPVVLMTGHKENEQTLANLKTVLTNNAYDVETCDLTQNETINRDAITIVFAAPTVDYSPEEIKTINAWLQQEGEYSRNMVLFTDYAADCPNLYSMVQEEYGLEVTDKIVRETAKYYGTNYAPYGDIAESRLSGDLTSSSVLALEIQQLILHKENDDTLSLYNMPLVTFGDTAQLETTPDEEEAKPIISDAETYPIVGAAVAHKQVPSATMNRTVDSFAVVFGSPYFLDQTILMYVNAAENEALFLNVFNAVSGSDSTITISSRAMNTTTLAFADNVAKWVGIGVFTVGLPVITLGIGLAIFLKRRHL